MGNVHKGSRRGEDIPLSTDSKQRVRSSELEKESANAIGEGWVEGVWRGKNGEGCQPKVGLMLPHMYH
jgi:hypothetical protein